MGLVRAPAVAGMFYPGSARELSEKVTYYLASATVSGAVPKAIIAPHAGYVYSGPVAANAYALLRPARGTIKRVVLIGPSHRVGFRGVAMTSAVAYAIPGGEIAIDQEAMALLDGMPGVGVLDAAHAQEHSLEVHLPFLRAVLGEFKLVPLVAGQADPQTISGVLDALWGGEETLIVISTDLSHYLDYSAAQKIDAATVAAIERLDPDGIEETQACGRIPVRGLLVTAKRRGMRVETLDVRNSGDTAGSKDRVVGYASIALYEA
jgi:AmmeMemoRadiSam system protein B